MNVTTQENFRNNLRAAMLARHLTQRQLASDTGISHPHINRILVGKASPTLPICETLADHLGFELRELLMTPSQFSGLIHSTAG